MEISPDFEEFDLSSMISHFHILPDPRVGARCQYELLDVVVITLVGLICNCDGIVDIADFAESRESWFKKYLKLPNGVPSHDTIGRILALLDAELFEQLFCSWVKMVVGKKKLKQISLDGKSLRGTEKSFNQGKRALHLVSLFSTDLGLTLAQKKSTSSGSSESHAGIAILKEVDIKDTLLSADAGFTSLAMIEAVRNNGADYLLPIKGNQKAGRTEIEAHFQNPKKKVRSFQTTEKNRGREEIRTCEVLTENIARYQDCTSIIRMVRNRTVKDSRYFIQKKDTDGNIAYSKNAKKTRTTTTNVYYISSRKLTAKAAMEMIRNHWDIENKLHWYLDVAFNEDSWRIREKKIAHNLSTLRKFAINLVKTNKLNIGVKRKMKKASREEAFLEELLVDFRNSF